MNLTEADIKLFLSNLELNKNNALLTIAMDRAAISGTFDLHALTRFAPEHSQVELRAQLLAFTETRLDSDGRLMYWLNQRQRTHSLIRLIENTELLQRTIDESPLTMTDAVGHELRRVLQDHQRIELANMKGVKLSALIQALEMLVAIGSPYNELWRRAVLEQRKRSQFLSYQELLANGLFGREQVLQQINLFIHDQDQEKRFLLVSGIGGSGKSALIAHLIQSLNDPDSKTKCLVFDFDRPALDPRGPGLTIELTHQLALLMPELNVNLQEIRKNVRQTYQAGGGSFSSSKQIELSERSSNSSNWELGKLVSLSGLGDTPIVVFFDTLEVISRHGKDAVNALFFWLNDILPYQIGLRKVRAILAGRAVDSFDFDKEVYYSFQTLTLPHLQLDGAVTLLERTGLKRRRAFKAARILGGNPLVLRLGGRYLHEHPKMAVRELQPSGGGGIALTQGMLYQRILRHVGLGADDPLRQVAYPGLALRYITPGILKGVILPALKISLSDPDKIDQLWQNLVSHTWLVEREKERLVRHRTDLREMMIQLVSRDDEIAASVKRLHQLAVQYHTLDTKDPDIPADRSRLERVYHRLMLLETDEDLPYDDHALVSKCLAGDFSGLSPHATALARLHSKQSLLIGDQFLLPIQYRELALAELGWAELDNDRANEAIKLLPEHVSSSTVWYLTAKQNAADWHSEEIDTILNKVHLNDQSLSKKNGDNLLITSQGRESFYNFESIIAFMHLWRSDFELITDPTKNIQIGAIKNLKTVERICILKKCAAYWASSLLISKKNNPNFGRLHLLVEDNRNRGEWIDSALEEELARLRLLLWQMGNLKENHRIGLTASMIAASPKRLSKFYSLTNKPKYINRTSIQNYHKNDRFFTTANLTGKVAQDIVEMVKYLKLDTVENLTDHGFSASDFSSGVWVELRPATRTLLRTLLRSKDMIEPFSLGLEGALIAADDPDQFIPYDLQQDNWLRAIKGGGGNKAIVSLVDWAGRTGRLRHVIDLGASLTPCHLDRFQNLSKAQSMLDSVNRAT